MAALSLILVPKLFFFPPNCIGPCRANPPCQGICLGTAQLSCQAGPGTTSIGPCHAWVGSSGLGPRGHLRGTSTVPRHEHAAPRQSRAQKRGNTMAIQTVRYQRDPASWERGIAPTRGGHSVYPKNSVRFLGLLKNSVFRITRPISLQGKSRPSTSVFG
jgi:hypothetical protein